jgi:hypothetical protein
LRAWLDTRITTGTVTFKRAFVYMDIINVVGLGTIKPQLTDGEFVA